MKDGIVTAPLSLPDGTIIFPNPNPVEEDSDISDRIDNLVDNIEKNEKEISEQLKKEYTNLSDEDLTSTYEKWRINKKTVLNLASYRNNP